MQPFDSLDRLEGLAALDPVILPLRTFVQRAFRPQALRDVLHGVWLGHPLHPVLTDVPIGCWTSAAVLDLVPGTGPAASTLIATGVAAWFPTAWAGWTDWSELHTPEQRTGLVHALANATALALYGGSLLARRRGAYGAGKLLGYAGLSSVLLGGMIGGHLSYRRAAGTNQTAYAVDTAPTEWIALARLEELPEGRPVVRETGRETILLYRSGSSVSALLDHCSHLNGPLHEGEVTGIGPDACVVCPWHGSTFRIRDGKVVHGPATAPQPTLEVRVLSDHVEVRLPPQA